MNFLEANKHMAIANAKQAKRRYPNPLDADIICRFCIADMMLY
jgi:hypothetical protein